jgi:DNA-binding transcriptional MerR regulator
MGSYLTCGQAAKKLRVSISTLKRWVGEPGLSMEELRNRNGWRLFSEEDLGRLKEFKKQLKRSGKRFNEMTLVPINRTNVKGTARLTSGNIQAML